MSSSAAVLSTRSIATCIENRKGEQGRRDSVNVNEFVAINLMEVLERKRRTVYSYSGTNGWVKQRDMWSFNCEKMPESQHR
jgi:hypothetical protein